MRKVKVKIKKVTEGKDMNKFTATMFDQMKTMMAEQRSTGSFKDIIKTEIGKSYVVRLIPNIKDVTKTTYHYYNHGWKSLATGQFVSCLCPTTFGERCPICEERIRLYRTGDGTDEKNAKLLSRKEQWLINAYVIEDQTKPENKDTIKLLRYGKQLDDIINDAVNGELSKELGMRIFDLSKNGCVFKIKVEKNNGGYPEYKKSRFIKEHDYTELTEGKIEEIYNNILNLENVFERKSTAQVKDMFETHYRCNIATSSVVNNNDDGMTLNDKDDDDNDMITSNEKEPIIEDEADKKLKEIMADL